MAPPATTERYGRVSRRMWGDETFLGLSAPKPNARDLWIYLLTGPHGTSLPGLFALGESGIAEAIRWPLAATRKHIAEIEGAKMLEIDRDSRLIWLPNALRHNFPPNPNVVLGWGPSWRLLPECALRNRATARFVAELAAASPALARAFQRVTVGVTVPETVSGTVPETVPERIQHDPFDKQDQEQEQDQECGAHPLARGSGAGNEPGSPEQAKIVAELKRHPALAAVATARLAEHIEGWRISTGKPLADVLSAIAEAARDHGASAAAGSPLTDAELAKQVMKYVSHARPGAVSHVRNAAPSGHVADPTRDYKWGGRPEFDPARRAAGAGK